MQSVATACPIRSHVNGLARKQRSSLQIKGLETGLLVARRHRAVRRRSTYREDDHNGWRNNSGRRNNSLIASTNPRTTSAALKHSKRKSEAVGKGHNEQHCGSW